MNIVSYNCQNLKSNIAMVKKLIVNSDVCFFIEHWLGEEESFYFSHLSDQHSILFDSDFNCAERLCTYVVKGRPFGGRCWVIKNNIRVIEYQNMSKALSRVSIEDLNGSRVSIFGVWQPFDDGSVMKLANLHTNLSMFVQSFETL